MNALKEHLKAAPHMHEAHKQDRLRAITGFVFSQGLTVAMLVALHAHPDALHAIPFLNQIPDYIQGLGGLIGHLSPLDGLAQTLEKIPFIASHIDKNSLLVSEGSMVTGAGLGATRLLSRSAARRSDHYGNKLQSLTGVKNSEHDVDNSHKVPSHVPVVLGAMRVLTNIGRGAAVAADAAVEVAEEAQHTVLPDWDGFALAIAGWHPAKMKNGGHLRVDERIALGLISPIPFIPTLPVFQAYLTGKHLLGLGPDNKPDVKK